MAGVDVGTTHPRSGHVQGAVAKFNQRFGDTEGLRESATAPVSKPAKKSKGFFGGLKDRVFGSDGTENEVFRMLMLGKTGSGKSTTGNTILGEKKFATGLDFSSVTGVCDLQIVEKGRRIIELMDCPGLYDTTISQEEVATTIMQAVACMHPGPHAILYIIRLGRFTAEEIGVFLRLKALFDDDITNYIIVVFTGGDDLEREKITLAELLKRAPKELIQLVDECGHRCFVFNNIDKKNKKQVEQLLDEVRRLKMAYGRYNCPKYASVGEDLEKEVERRLAKVTKNDPERAKHIFNLETKLNETTESLQKLTAETEKKEREREIEKRKRAQEEEKICQERAKAKAHSEEEMKLKDMELKSYCERLREEMSNLNEERENERRELLQKQEEKEKLEEQRHEEEKKDQQRNEEELIEKQKEMERLEKQRREEEKKDKSRREEELNEKQKEIEKLKEQRREENEKDQKRREEELIEKQKVMERLEEYGREEEKRNQKRREEELIQKQKEIEKKEEQRREEEKKDQRRREEQQKEIERLKEQRREEEREDQRRKEKLIEAQKEIEKREEQRREEERKDQRRREEQQKEIEKREEQRREEERKDQRRREEKQKEIERLKEQKREEEREDQRRREEAYREELNRVKKDVAKNKKSSWLKKAAAGVAKAVGRFFGR